MTTDNNGDKGLLEPSHCLLDQNQRDKYDGAVEDHNTPSEDGLKRNGIVNGVKDVIGGAAQTQHVLQIQQQQPQAIVRWERFFHVRSLRVLLVEYDDSTRHVVSALLRNCSYEVIEASNVLQAWKVLEDLNNRVDLVLTEVVMPCLTGLGLLSKIMSHQTRKNVPIIMMSSHDSMGLVFKCLSKGAVDFLLKPIRKNELKNLWQHVWRRCHSSSGSGSESGTQTQKSIKSKSIERSNNNNGSNDEEDNLSSGSDSGSATQSSWTKQAAEIGSPQPLSVPDAVVECTDSTCAQVIHSNAETSQNKQALAIGALKSEEVCNAIDISAIGRDFEMGPRNLDLPLEQPTDVSKQNNLFEKASGKFHEKMENGNLDLNRGISSGIETTNMTGPGTSTTDHQKESREIEGPNTVSASNTKGVPNDDRFLEFSLKRLRAVKDIGLTVNNDRNVFQRSDSSAFSRYNTASNKYRVPAGNSLSGSPDENNSNSKEKELGHGDPPNQCSNTDMGSTTNRSVAMTVSAKNQSAVTSTLKYPDPSSFRPMRDDMAFTALQVIKEKTDESAAKTQQLPLDPDDLLLKAMAASAPHCGSSNVLGGGNAGNYSVNGSNHGSNGPNGSVIRADQSKFAQREASLKKFRQKRNERCFHKKVRYQSRKRLAEQRPRVRGQFVRKIAAEEKTSDATNSDSRLT